MFTFELELWILPPRACLGVVFRTTLPSEARLPHGDLFAHNLQEPVAPFVSSDVVGEPEVKSEILNRGAEKTLQP